MPVPLCLWWQVDAGSRNAYHPAAYQPRTRLVGKIATVEAPEAACWRDIQWALASKYHVAAAHIIIYHEDVEINLGGSLAPNKQLPPHPCRHCKMCKAAWKETHSTTKDAHPSSPASASKGEGSTNGSMSH